MAADPVMKSSPYYPPRAGSWSRFNGRMHRFEMRLRRWVATLGSPAYHLYISFSEGIPWLLVPGLMWRQRGRAKLGNGVLVAWAVLVVIHVTTLNMSLANLVATGASMLHAISAAAVLGVIYPEWQGLSRVLKTVLFTSLLVFAIYSIGLRILLGPIASRVTTQGFTVMVHGNGWFPKRPWTQGEWVVYQFANGATGMDRILAGPGDTLRFHEKSFEVNGRHFERISRQMPSDGEIDLDKGVYFIWPTTATFNHGGGEDLPEWLLNFTKVPAANIIGRPYRHWLGKSSDLANLKPVQNPDPDP